MLYHGWREISLGKRGELVGIKNKIMVYRYDFLVIGSGIAGMSFALKVARFGKVAIVAKNPLEDANTYYAQGGIASVTNPWITSRTISRTH